MANLVFNFLQTSNVNISFAYETRRTYYRYWQIMTTNKRCHILSLMRHMT